MNNLYAIRSQKTWIGQTAGGILRTAKICKMQSGNYDIFVTDKKGKEYQSILTNDYNLLLSDHGTSIVLLTISDTSVRKMQKLEKRCNELMIKDDLTIKQYL